jgi:hypothetical protein
MTGDKDINIKFIDSEDQRYPTCGDYWETDTSYEFRITKQVRDERSILILLHEMVEYFLCTRRGISEQEITEFDLEWEQKRQQGDQIADEPGNEPDAPYYWEHRFSENVERIVALEADIDWEDYERKLII